MKYILSEEEYNTLQSRIQSLESTNKKLRRDLAGTEREIAKLTQRAYGPDDELISKAFLEAIKSGL